MRPLQLVTLSGGLGNQMFQYAFLVHLRRHGARVFPYLGKIRHYGEHNGYELERVFGIALTPGERAMDGVLGLPLLGAAVKHIVFPFKYRERGESDCAANAALAARHASTRFTGYWQGECFFADVADEVRRLYRFDERRLNAQSRSLAERLHGSTDTVSLHVRRGDYYKKDGSDRKNGRSDSKSGTADRRDAQADCFHRRRRLVSRPFPREFHCCRLEPRSRQLAGHVPHVFVPPPRRGQQFVQLVGRVARRPS